MKLRLRVSYPDYMGAFRIPNWYGVAYREYDCSATILYPIPLNLIVRFWRWLHCGAKQGFRRFGHESKNEQIQRLKARVANLERALIEEKLKARVSRDIASMGGPS